jgi:hypothetical protein
VRAAPANNLKAESFNHEIHETHEREATTSTNEHQSTRITYESEDTVPGQNWPRKGAKDAKNLKAESGECVPVAAPLATGHSLPRATNQNLKAET